MPKEATNRTREIQFFKQTFTIKCYKYYDCDFAGADVSASSLILGYVLGMVTLALHKFMMGVEFDFPFPDQDHLEVSPTTLARLFLTVMGVKMFVTIVDMTNAPANNPHELEEIIYDYKQLIGDYAVHMLGDTSGSENH